MSRQLNVLRHGSFVRKLALQLHGCALLLHERSKIACICVAFALLFCLLRRRVVDLSLLIRFGVSKGCGTTRLETCGVVVVVDFKCGKCFEICYVQVPVCDFAMCCKEIAKKISIGGGI